VGSGPGLACPFSILDAMWLEFASDADKEAG
jgi:cyd operon protein YbgT